MVEKDLHLQSPGYQFLKVLEQLEANNLSGAERFELTLTYCELLYGFGFKQSSARELKLLCRDNPSSKSLLKLVHSLDPTWTPPLAGNQNTSTSTIAESDFDITVLDD